MPLFLSDLDAVAEGEADAAVGADRRVIQQFSPRLRIEFRHLPRQSAQCVDESLHSGLGGNQDTTLFQQCSQNEREEPRSMILHFAQLRCLSYRTGLCYGGQCH